MARKASITRGALLEAARQVIGKKGYSGATTDDIAREAGVSKGMVYYHFRSKADIATSILTSGLREIEDSFARMLDSGLGAHQALVGMLTVFADRIFENPDFSRFILTELWRNEREWSEALNEQGELLLDQVIEVIRRGIAEGGARPGTDTRFYAVATIGTVLASSQYFLNDPTPGAKDEFIADAVDYISHALGPSSAAV